MYKKLEAMRTSFITKDLISNSEYQAQSKPKEPNKLINWADNEFTKLYSKTKSRKYTHQDGQLIVLFHLSDNCSASKIANQF